MANNEPGGRATRWLPDYSWDPATRTLSVYCRNNVEAIAAVEVAKEHNLTSRRFHAPLRPWTPILIVSRDERPMPVGPEPEAQS